MIKLWRAFRFPILGAVLIGIVSLVLFRKQSVPQISVSLGDQVTVFDYSVDACDRQDIPDTAARAFRDSAGTVNLFASHHVTRRETGPSLDELTRDCRVVMASHDDPRPERFDDREWIAALYTPDGENVAALVHNEYQGHRHGGRCPSGSYRRCWYNSITLAGSTDSGRTFSHDEPPDHLVASLPTRYLPDSGPQGVFSASNIVERREDGYFYAMFQLVSDREGSGTCLMRTVDPFDAGSWRAWDGEGFGTRFVNPYRASAGSGRTCAPVSPDEISTMRQSLTYNTALEKYLLIGVAQAWDPEQARDVPGIYLSTSDDLITWTRRQLVMEAELPWTFNCGDDAPVNYPSLIDPASPSRNFEVTSDSGYLYFTRLNYRDCKQQLDRDLIRVPLTLKKAG